MKLKIVGLSSHGYKVSIKEEVFMKNGYFYVIKEMVFIHKIFTVFTSLCVAVYNVEF